MAGSDRGVRVAGLDGIRVLDFGRFVAGPYCAAMLADFGADVIRVERPGGGEDRALTPVSNDPGADGAIFLQANRNKRSVTLDPRSAGAAPVLRRLVASADVIVANMPAPTLAKMGIDYEAARAIRPDIVVANVSAFGAEGPWAGRPGFDSVAQAMAGAAYLTGEGETPFRTPISWVDHATAVYTAFGIMVALLERAATGQGRQVDGSLLGSALAYASTYLVEEAMTGIGRRPTGNRSGINGPTDLFRTADGWIVVQVIGPQIFRRWAALMAAPELLKDPRFATDQLRGQNGALLSERMAAWCVARRTDEALEALGGAGVPAGPVLTPREALEHPQVRATELIQSVWTPGLDRDALLIGAPIRMDGRVGAIRRPPPTVGEHTDEVLQALGFDAGEVAELRRAGVV
jgi:crotonobetainyl-CoA:carnitine CoA-transferase CaiB-like acyl-CoA transferase